MCVDEPIVISLDVVADVACASFHKIILLLPVVRFVPAQAPTATLLEADVVQCRAFTPTTVL